MVSQRAARPGVALHRPRPAIQHLDGASPAFPRTSLRPMGEICLAVGDWIDFISGKSPAVAYYPIYLAWKNIYLTYFNFCQ